jgi:formate hydrogenlyase subunit 6/NADH:ubiquinone oxidoreductase subunit I
MRAPKLRELKEAVRALIVGPYTANFPAEPTPVPESFRGRPRFDEDECVGCGGCANVCPPGALEMEDDLETGFRRLTVHLDRCIFCGQCHANCLTERGIEQTNEYDLSTTDRSTLREGVEKALLLCEACGAVIGARDHVLWVARRLGPLAFANPTLMLTALEDEGLADKEPPPSEELRRGDKLRVLCPKCRQITSLKA